MASWALEGMKPDRETIADINAYLEGATHPRGVPPQVEDRLMGTGNDERFVDPYAYHRAQCPTAGFDPT
jgi:hypothetical protein